MKKKDEEGAKTSDKTEKVAKILEDIEKMREPKKELQFDDRWNDTTELQPNVLEEFSNFADHIHASARGEKKKKKRKKRKSTFEQVAEDPHAVMTHEEKTDFEENLNRTMDHIISDLPTPDVAFVNALCNAKVELETGRAEFEFDEELKQKKELTNIKSLFDVDRKRPKRIDENDVLLEEVLMQREIDDWVHENLFEKTLEKERSERNLMI